MTASEIITLFVETSGRYDFVDTEGIPSTRAYTILNSAQKWLDRELGQAKHDVVLYKDVLANATTIEFPHPRYIAGLYDENETWLYWRGVPFDGEGDTAEWPYRTIEILPSTLDRTLTVKAVWKSVRLANSTDISFWTEEDEELLVRAMQLQCEIDMRNTQGVNDFLGPLQYDVKKIYHDMVAEEMAGPSEIWRMD